MAMLQNARLPRWLPTEILRFQLLLHSYQAQQLQQSHVLHYLVARPLQNILLSILQQLHFMAAAPTTLHLIHQLQHPITALLRVKL